ncbi:MAG: carbohydrate kinase family protein [Thermoplasmata archaeon]
MFLSVFGHINLDIIIKVGKIPEEGSIPVKETVIRAGGTARNIAYVSGLLGIDVEIFSRIGGGFPKIHIDELTEKGVNVDNIIVKNEYGMSPVCFIVSDGSRQVAFIDQGPMSEITYYKNLPRGEWIHFSTGNPEEYIKIKKLIRGKFSFDPGQEIHYRYNREKFSEMVDGTEIFFANEIEFEKALEFMDESDILEKTKNVIVTMGERGCMLISKEGKIILPAYSVKKRDTVGAGDSFRAGFYAGLKNGLDLINSCKLGMKVASIIVSKGGIPEKLPNINTLIKSL